MSTEFSVAPRTGHREKAVAPWREPGFWREREPRLHVDDSGFLTSLSPFEIDTGMAELGRDLLRREGYFQLDPLAWALPIEAMAECIHRLAASGIPLPFAYVYDEFWLAFVRLNSIIAAMLGPGFRRLPDFWAWRIDPAREEKGWRPHRDKGYQALFADRGPKSVTIWIPLTDANPQNGCMYIVPADRDPTYGTPDDNNWKFDYADIRALPATAGSAFFWNQAVLHWGSHASRRGGAARVSIAFEYQAGRVPPFNQPLTDPESVPLFEFRLRLIGKQILQYQHMYPLSPDVAEVARQMVES